MSDCLFCRIARKETPAVVLHEDDQLLAFLDIGPIREGHTQIIPKAHFDTFDVLPSELAAQILDLGQQLARRMKEIFGVDRVAFLFTGGDVPHAHAHVVPLKEKTDITSAQYIVERTVVTWDSSHLLVERPTLERVRDRLAFIAAPPSVRRQI
jgi:histidine triad (HIT) family protein